MSTQLPAALAQLREVLLSPALVRAVAAGRRRGQPPPPAGRAELRPIDLKGQLHLQLVTSDDQRPVTHNLAYGEQADRVVDELLAAPYGNWHVESTEVTWQLRVTKRGDAQLHRGPGVAGDPARAGHDRARQHLLDPGDPLFDVIGGDASKRRQVDAFLRSLAALLPADPPQPLTVADLGCGNAYLTFAAYQWLTKARGLAVTLTGVEVRPDQLSRNTALAQQLGWQDQVRFVAGTIADAPVEPPPVLVLALHACDTATDDALARAVGWGARWILAAPCCHQELARQLRRSAAPPPYQLLTRHGILRERFADVLTDSLRAALLRQHGYRVDVVEFIESRHTARNLLLRAELTGAAPTAAQHAEYDALTAAWSLTPALARLLAEPTATPPP